MPRSLRSALVLASCLAATVAGSSVLAVAAPAAVVVSLSGGRLVVTGTSGAERITLTSASGKVVVTSNRPVRRTGGAVLVAKIGAIVVKGGAGADTLVMAAVSERLPGAKLVGGAGNDVLRGGRGDDVLVGGSGDDTYRFTGAAGGADTVQEVSDEADGVDTVTFADRSGAVAFDLSSVTRQVVGTGLAVTLTSGSSVENLLGGPDADTLTGNLLDNRLSGGAGADTFTVAVGTNHDLLADFDVAEGDRVATSSVVGDLSLDEAGDTLTDRRGPGYGLEADLSGGVRTAGALTTYGSAGGGGTLVTWDGSGGFAQPTTQPVLLTSYSSAGQTLSGAAGADHLVDRSTNGNTLVGRDGSDYLEGGPGDDVLQGDRGFESGLGTTDWLSGGAGADTFVAGVAFGGQGTEAFGSDVVVDFEHGVDTVDLAEGMYVKDGIGSDDVNVFLGDQFVGSLTGTTAWEAGDFS